MLPCFTFHTFLPCHQDKNETEEACRASLTLTGIGQSAFEGDILFQAAAVPHFHCLIAAGTGEEEAIPGHSQLIHPLSVLGKVSHEDPLGVPWGLGNPSSAQRPSLRRQTCNRQCLVRTGLLQRQEQFDAARKRDTDWW